MFGSAAANPSTLRRAILAAATIGLCLAALPLAAQSADLPARFEVAGVGGDDRLNIRAAPDAGSTLLGSYLPDATDIEVLETTPDGKWGRVGLAEGNGWVAMRYLARQDGDSGAVPRPFSCRGTEPFWALSMTDGGDEYASPETGRRALNLIEAQSAQNGHIVRFVEGPTLTRTIIVIRGACSDGMSDRAYGWRALLFNDAPDVTEAREGCCTLDGAN